MYGIRTKNLGIFLLCYSCILSLSAQNLVKNPSFETFVDCPKRLGNFDTDVADWSIPTQGSTDYFNACSTAMGTPKNFNGQQLADFGKGYAGLYLYAPEDYREYLQAELSQTLEQGKEYKVSFFVSLAERSDFAIKEFGVLFSSDKLVVPTKKELAKRYWYQQKGNSYNYLEIGYSKFYDDKEDWISISTRFTAKGSERFLILGNFKNNVRTRMFKTKKTARQGAYYYMDMVKVEAVKGGKGTDIASASLSDSSNSTSSTDTASLSGPTSEKNRKGVSTKHQPSTEGTASTKGTASIKGQSTPYALNKTHLIEDVLFDFDRFVILESAKVRLKDLSNYLMAHPELKITISGHTDAVGQKEYNRRLSVQRAQVICDYLVELGVPKNRIISEGHGGEQPIASNDTETGRQRNRRVEFLISRE